MLRRDAVALLLAASRTTHAATPASLSRFFDATPGTALLLNVPARRLLAVHGPSIALPPGSTLKPFVLEALLEAGKLGPAESFPCRGELRLRGRSFRCSHPPLTVPLHPRTALAYSCNCFVAHVAERFSPAELALHLNRAGLASLTGLLGPTEIAGTTAPAATSEETQLQALGEAGVLVTPAGLAIAYRRLALSIDQPNLKPILEGLEDAVEFGTAQRARIDGFQVAGKTGSVRSAGGVPLAWFAGFGPSRKPEVVVTVVLQGRSGGADAAPIAAKILEAWRAGRV